MSGWYLSEPGHRCDRPDLEDQERWLCAECGILHTGNHMRTIEPRLDLVFQYMMIGREPK